MHQHDTTPSFPFEYHKDKQNFQMFSFHLPYIGDTTIDRCSNANPLKINHQASYGEDRNRWHISYFSRDTHLKKTADTTN